MLTLKELNIREFQMNGNQVTKTSKGKSPISIQIDNKDFMDSKPFWNQSKIVTMNAHDVMSDVLGMLKEQYPSIDNWGKTFVYRDKVDIHGYTDSYNPNGSIPMIHPDVPISDLAFSRVIAKMNILGDDKYNASIALKWEPTQIQIAIGTNVRICDNFNILGASTFLKTNRSLTYENIRFELKERLLQIESQFGASIETINNLIAKPITAKQTRFILGDLITKYDYDQPIINFTDIHEISRKVVDFEKKGNPVTNLWDLTNIGTDILKFDNSAGDTSFEHLQNWNSYLESFLNGNN